MPVSFTVVKHPARGWKQARASSPEDIFKDAAPEDCEHNQRIIQSSLGGSTLKDIHISASKNGFIWAAYHAYSHHHHLTIRPEDVWFAILTQLSFYITKNAESLRHLFVSHQGQKELVVKAVGSLTTVDFGPLAEAMTDKISENTKDPTLRSWIMPSFSTTTDTDRVTASVLFMGAMQKYFTYSIMLTCGIPSVTLLGNVSDWEDMLARMDKIEQLGAEAAQFVKLMRPILRHMILSFEQPTSPDVVRFWNLIASRVVQGSGMHFTTGWIGAFCFWDQDGHVRHAQSNDDSADGLAYPRLDLDEVPVGIASVPVKIDDNGVTYDCTFLAGSFGIQATLFDEKHLPPGPTVGESRIKAQKGGADGNKVQKEIDALEAAFDASSDEDKEDGARSAEVAEPGALTMIQPLSGWLLYENDGTNSRPEGASSQPQEATPSRLREFVSPRRWRWWPRGTR